MRTQFYLISLIVFAAIAGLYFVWPPILWVLVLIGPLFLLGIVDILQNKHTIVKNFPIVGRLRYVMEKLRPKIYQYFVESDIDGRPFNRVERSVVYQRAKNVRDTTPFGTQLNVYEEGYEWVNYSINAVDHHHLEEDPRVKVGGPACKQPYELSLLNISAMSFGSLSKNAVMALNGGAQIGGFAHNTGEGSISPYHVEHGGDLIFQIGTGLFGARDPQQVEPVFSPEEFKKNAARPFGQNDRTQIESGG